MAFLYGDSTPSPLDSNFLEFLRDALDFSVTVLLADTNIEKIKERKTAHAKAADEELERLQSFGRVVMAAIEDAPKGEDDSETSRCAANLTAAAAEAVIASTDTAQRTLAADVAQAEADEAAQRGASYEALEALLLPHALPESKITRRLERQPDGTYRATLSGEGSIGLHWRTVLAIPDGHVFASGNPIERLVPQLEFHAPEQTGWLKKEVKPRPQRVERFSVTEIDEQGDAIRIALRAPGGETGFDFAVNLASTSVMASKIARDGDAPFELAPDDLGQMFSVAQKLHESLADLAGERLEEATFDGGEFRAHPVFRAVVDRLVRQMAPIVHQIARHSLTRTELVIRRLLSNERREEIFVTKKTLRDKYSSLPHEQRSLFDAFGFDTLPPPAPTAIPAPPPAPKVIEVEALETVEATEIPAEAGDPGAVRTEVKPSQPPPPPSWVRPPRGSGSPPSGPTWRRPPPRSEPE